MSLIDETQDQVEKLANEEGESETPETTEDTEVVGEEQQEQPKEEVPQKSEEVPVSFQKRINELVYKSKSAEERVKTLESELSKIRHSTMSEEEKKEKSARDYLKGLLKEELAEVKRQEEESDRALEEEISNVNALYPDFNKTEVLKVMDEFKIANVETAYNAWKKMNRVVEETKEKTKKEIISKPKSPSAVKTSDGLSSKFTEDSIKGKSLWELAEEAKREAGL